MDDAWSYWCSGRVRDYIHRKRTHGNIQALMFGGNGTNGHERGFSGTEHLSCSYLVPVLPLSRATYSSLRLLFKAYTYPGIPAWPQTSPKSRFAIREDVLRYQRRFVEYHHRPERLAIASPIQCSHRLGILRIGSSTSYPMHSVKPFVLEP